MYCRARDIGPDAERFLEREANVFAAELLMPEDAVRTAFARGEVLASRLGVSEEAIGWRLYNFGLVASTPLQ